ncbi:hypothetical protein CWC28_21950, partial [Pseudoalteromonas sp. S4492]|uniref:hypothetical protein n=1 Tax=Pseudoalteromonas sp. S4492 TaxID=579560 RepID=UPI00127AB11F
GNGTYTVSQVEEINTASQVAGRANVGWSVTGNNEASDGGLKFIGISALNTNGGAVSNGTGGQQTVALADNAFTVANIQFSGSTSYTGHSSDTDIVTDGHNGTSWLLKGQNSAQTGNFLFNNIGTVQTTDQVQ